MSPTATYDTTPAALDAMCIRHETPCGDGSMVWREWGTGAPLVLLHGGSGSWRHWLRNIEALSMHYRVIAADMPGFGSSALPPDPVTFASLGQILGSGLDAIVDKGTAYHAAGFSLGSFIAPHMIKQCARRCKSLALVHGHLVGKMEYSPQESLKRWRHLEDAAERRETLRHNLGALMLAHPEIAGDATIDLYRQDVEAARLRVPAFIDSLDTSILAELETKLCAISGALDPIAAPDLATQIAKLRAMRPDAETEIIANTGHWVMYEAAEAFNQLALQWLARNA